MSRCVCNAIMHKIKYKTMAKAVLLQIKEKRLPKNVKAEKIGNTYSLTVRGQKKE